jgi:hypothetical protein
MFLHNQRQPFHYGTPIKSHNIDKSAIHFLHLISIGHAPLFHVVSYMENIVRYIPLSSYNKKMKEQKTCPCVGKHMYLNI